LVPPSIDVTVGKIPPLPSGASIKQRFTVEASDHNGRLLDGIGDVAFVESVINASAEVKFVEGALLRRHRAHGD
jgi:hypothetical protein